MPLETATKLSELNPLWPLSDDFASQGDDHVRLLKGVAQGDALSKADGGTVQGPLTVAANLLGTTATFNSTLVVGGKTTVNAELEVNGLLDVNGAASVSSDLTIGDDLVVNDDARVEGVLTTQQRMVANGGILLGADQTLQVTRDTGPSAIVYHDLAEAEDVVGTPTDPLRLRGQVTRTSGDLFVEGARLEVISNNGADSLEITAPGAGEVNIGTPDNKDLKLRRNSEEKLRLNANNIECSVNVRAPGFIETVAGGLDLGEEVRALKAQLAALQARVDAL